jgi:hypothetical protein
MTTPDKPSRFHASPAQIDAFLRQHFAEDALLNFYQAVGKHVYLAGMADVMSEMWDFRYYPAKLPKLETYNRPFNPPRGRYLPDDSDPVECECGRQWPNSQSMPPNHNDMDCQPDPAPKAVTPEEFDRVLEASSLGAPHVKAVREHIPEDVREQLAKALQKPRAEPDEPDVPCYRTKAHQPHRWLKNRKAVPCPGTPRETP